MRPVTLKAPILGLVVTMAAGTLWAQDPVKVAPKNFRVLLENDHVRVLDFHAAGEKIPMHSHPSYVSYSVAGAGKTKFTSADGKVTEAPSKTGQATWHEAETHATEYLGKGEAHVILIELKTPAKPKP